MRRFIEYIYIILAISCLCACRQELVIIHFNDTHSHLEPERSGEVEGRGGVIERAAYVDSVRKSVGEENVLLVHAGDFDQGTPYFTKFNGDLEIRLMNAMKYDVTALGNHEFDNGIEELTRRLSSLICPVVCANYDFSSLEIGKYVQPYTIIRKAGKKIGVIGLITDLTKVVDRTISDRLPKYDDAEVVNRWADYLKNSEKCDLVMVLSHLGINVDMELIPQVANVDLLVGGHSHTFIDEPVIVPDANKKSVPIVQNGCWGLNVGKITYTGL